MFKKDGKINPDIDIEKWFNVIHNDLYQLHADNQNKGNSSQKIKKELTGLRDSLLYDACSGVGYVYEDKYYNDINDINLILEDVDDLDEIEIARVISVDYLLNFIDQILRK